MISLSQQEIENRIFSFRNQQVMIDRDLAELYGVETKTINQAVKRNLNRFPDTFRFQLDRKETVELVTNCYRLQTLKHSVTYPYAFTEQGVAMLSAILKSDIAVQVSIQIINAFVKMRSYLMSNSLLLNRLDNLERKQFKTEESIDKIFKALNPALPRVQGIFFDGQIFDAYVFVIELIKSARKSIVLIDNYVDESVLLMLAKRKKNVRCEIFTQNLTAQLNLDLQKHNAQYEKISITPFKKAHDRFIIIDNQQVYHIGASLKDLGKKWFAFSKIETDADRILMEI